ncbi:MAG: hypothetical protein M3283_09620 [Actinomycetota bacterium]|nr:hypothetical protein [Actinomycetota bacterium]
MNRSGRGPLAGPRPIIREEAERELRAGGIASHLKVNEDTKEEKMVRLTDSNEEEVHAKIRRAYEDAMKMEEQERAQKQTMSYIEVGLVFLAGFLSALILTAYNC